MKPKLTLAPGLTLAVVAATATALAGLTVAATLDSGPPRTWLAQAAPVTQTAPETPSPAVAPPTTQAQLATDAPVPQDRAIVRTDPVPGLAGPYLAARQAASDNDFVAASRYFRQAVGHDEADLFLQDGALVSMVSAGETDEAVAVARRLLDSGRRTELAALVERIDLARAGDWNGVLELLDKAPTTPVGGGPLLDGMFRGWAQLGAGKASEAFATLEGLATEPGAAGMARFQLALAKASVGDYEAAAATLEDPEVSTHLLGLMARAQVLSQLERNADAIAMLDEVDALDSEPALIDLRARLAVGERIPFDVVRTPRDGLAQVMVTFGGALMGGEETEPLALIYARLAQYLSPDMSEARLLTAQLLQSAGQFDLAEREFEALRAAGETRPAAELARIDTLARAGREPDAEAAARALTQAYPQLAPAWVALGDLLRQQDKFADAVPVYDKALEILQKNEDPQASWFALYARGISLERSGQFDRADADFQAALALQPEQAPILNYLGYSWVDRNVRLDEGLELIKKAVALRPDDGYILDSLAWAYYRLGRYADAVEPMEKAVSAMSEDSLVNDHMGDIYWMVGRKREAEIQWKRAQSLYKPEDTDTDLDRIRAKLEVGLDAVLEAEATNGGKLPPGFGQPEPAPAETANADTAPSGDGADAPADAADEAVPPRP